jgi:hypothetical protein
VEDARRFVDDFTAYLETRQPEVLVSIREAGTLSDESEATLKEAIEAFSSSFAPSHAAAGSEAAAGRGSKPDEVRRDVGWDRMSSIRDDHEERTPEERTLEEQQESFEWKAGPISDTDAPAPPG